MKKETKTINQSEMEKNWEKIAEEWMELAVKRECTLEEILLRIAESGAILPVVWAGAMRSIPGYNPKNAPLLENQMFGSDGFPQA